MLRLEHPFKSHDAIATAVRTHWGYVRALSYGMRVAWVSLLSVVVGTFILVESPQGQDLFLESRASLAKGALFWAAFYGGVLLFWVMPIYLSSSWILRRFRADSAGLPTDCRPVADWVVAWTPHLLVALAFAVLLIGQVKGLANAPTILSTPDAGNPKPYIIFLYLASLITAVALHFRRSLSVRTFWAINRDSWHKTFGRAVGLLLLILVPTVFGLFLPAYEKFFEELFGGGDEKGVIIVPMVVTLILFILTPLFYVVGLGFVLTRRPGIAWVGALVFRLYILVIILPVMGLMLFLFYTRAYEFFRVQLNTPLSMAHMALLPVLTAILGILAWRYLPGRAAGTEGTAGSASAQSPFDSYYDALDKAFVGFAGSSLCLVLLLAWLDPIAVTAVLFRALLIPLFLGLLVPIFTVLSLWSFRLSAPIILILTVAIAAFYPDNHDVKQIKKAGQRADLEQSVKRWRAANQCAAGAAVAAPECPSPIIIAAAGGASRAAFLVGTVMGELLDRRATSTGDRLRSFEKQLFAVSSVSGAALASAVAYAALADGYLEERGTTLGAPPCKGGADTSDWFAPHMRKEVRPHESWRDCLQLLLSGDFLSPIFVSLASNDLFGIGRHGDRGAVLEQTWERRYGDLTRKRNHLPDGRSGLQSSIIDLRQAVLDRDPQVWLPIMLVNGTSVSTGRRIITSDVDTVVSSKTSGIRGRLFRDSYDFHDLVSAPPVVADAAFSPDGRSLLTIYETDGVAAQLWDGEARAVIGSLVTGTTVGRGQIYWAADSSMLLTSTSEGVKLWDAKTRERRLAELLPREDSTRGWLSKDGRALLTWREGEAVLWDAHTGEKNRSFTVPQWVRSAQLSPDRRRALVLEENVGSLRDTESGETLAKLDNVGWARKAMFTRNGERVITIDGFHGSETINVFDASNGRNIYTAYVPAGLVEASPDGERIIRAPRTGPLTLHDFGTGQEITVTTVPGERVEGALFSPDGRRVLTWDETGTARLRDALQGTLLFSFRGQEGRVKGAVFTPDGRRVFTWSNNGMGRLWDLEQGEELRIARGSRVDCQHCDLQLSTTVTMSARFPIVSPHGNIRDAQGRIVDRVVDGGYFENFGAITALELATELRTQFGLKPKIILISNEPSASGMSCITADSQISLPSPPDSIMFSTLQSPLAAMWETRNARGTHAAVDLCSQVDGGDNFAFITVHQDESNLGNALSMSWWLSKHVQWFLDEQVKAEGSMNQSAFKTIEGWRRF